MPTKMPAKFNRRKFENFCVYCKECRQKNKRLPCYVRRLNHWYTSNKVVKEDVQCGRCGESIPEKTSVVAQKVYAWPGVPNDAKDGPDSFDPSIIAPTGQVVTNSVRRAQSGAWDRLSPDTHQKFKVAGLGRGLKPRTPSEAKAFYESSIPPLIRIQGEKEVLRFINGKQASHKISVSNNPSMARIPSNLSWEDKAKNLARGKRNMTPADVAAINTAYRRAGISATAKGAASGGIAASAVELPVAGVENFLHWKRGRKTGGQATKDAALSTVGAGAVGAGMTVVATGVAKGAILVGISPTLGPAGVPIVLAGAGLMLGGTIYRLVNAAKRDIPLDEYHIFFCKDADCKTRFAFDVTNGRISRET